MNRSSRRGSTSLVALVTVSTLAFIAGSFIVRITSRSREAYHSASWIEAGQAAESAAGVALAEIRRVLPATNKFPSDPWADWDADLAGVATTAPLTRTLSADLTLTLSDPLRLAHVGEGNQSVTAQVSIDAPATLIDAAGQQWYRIRATGTAGLPGSARASLSAADRTLRRLAFVRDWSSGARVATPQVSRTVEWIVQPAPPFPAALQSVGLLTATGSNVIDSYDSTNTTKSTGGEYDSAKAQAGGDVLTSNSTISLAGTVRGDVATNGTAPGSGVTVSGTVKTDHYQTLAPVSAPDWGFIMNYFSYAVSSASSATTSSTGTPARYHLSSVSSTLTLKANRSTGGALLPSKVELWIDGDLTGGITVENGVQATIYLAGNINTKSASLANPSLQPANLQIYGIQPTGTATRSITLTMNGDLHAAIYAPGHGFTVSGSSGELMGSFTANTLKLTNSRKVHYDESLARRAAVTVDYRLASWIEDVPPR